MDKSSIFILGSVLCVLCVLSWIYFQNAKTLSERVKLVYIAMNHSNWMDQIKILDQDVPYEKHLWYRVMLRDPFQLYPKEWGDEFRRQASLGV